MEKTRFHVAIVGAGLGGLAAAIGISRAGHEVTILEQAAILSEIGAGIQVAPNATRVFRRWGILENIEAHSIFPNDLNIRSYRDGKILTRQNLVPFTQDVYGNPFLHVHRADIHRELVKEAERLGVKFSLDSHVVGVDFDTPAAILKDKSLFKADLIIGADGLKSACRETMLGHPDPPRLTGDLAYRIIVKAEDMRKHPELGELIKNPAINFWAGPDGHVVCYLLKGGNLYNVVLICPDNLPEMVNTAKADLKEMNDIFQTWDPKLRLILGLVQETMKWRMQNSEEMQTWSHPSGKFVLLGDACHATLPYLAQGAAQAIEDGAVLGALFQRIETRAQLPDLLLIYEHLRKPRATRVVKRSTYQQQILHLPDGPRQRERDRQWVEYQDSPFEGFPNPWRDPTFQPWLFGWDAEREVEQAWSCYKRGVMPGTVGAHCSNL